METSWRDFARRLVQGLGVQPGELIQVRDGTGRPDVLQEVLLAIELAGATPLPLFMPAGYMERLWREAPQEYLAQWDQHRAEWTRQNHRRLRLEGAAPELGDASQEGFNAWLQAVHRLTDLEEERHQPYIIAAVPTERRASQLGLSLDELESILLPALAIPTGELRREIDRLLAVVRESPVLAIHTGDGHVLHLDRGDRPWLDDDGRIDPADQARGAYISNWPSGSLYTTVLENSARGSLWLPRAGAAVEAVLHFEQGRIVSIEASRGAGALAAWLDHHSGQPRRISHIGLGLNPRLALPLGWTLPDRMIRGHLFIALGDNRYMGGQNESSLNVDYDVPGATLAVGERTVVAEGKVVV